MAGGARGWPEAAKLVSRIATLVISHGGEQGWTLGSRPGLGSWVAGDSTETKNNGKGAGLGEQMNSNREIFDACLIQLDGNIDLLSPCEH